MKLFDATGAPIRKTMGFNPKIERIPNEHDPIEGGCVSAVGFSLFYDLEDSAEAKKAKSKEFK